MENNEQRLRFGLIGCGRISQVHLECLAKEPSAQLVAVADTDRAAADRAASAFSASAYSDPRKMIDECALDAVVLCTPPNTHKPLAELSLGRGLHVLCEKPLALSVEDASAMVETASKAGRVLMMASKFRYVQDIVRAKNIMDSGLLGDIVLFENEFCSRVDMTHRWNAHSDVSGGGVLIDNGSHSVDIVRFLLGPIETLQAIYGKPFYIHVYGTAGTLEIGWKTSRYREREKPDWLTFGNGYDKYQAMGAQLRNFVETIGGRATPVIDHTDAIESVRVVQAAYRSANQNRWEKVSS
ncbi:MAG: Gfo/Idh/MocA family oxidoreductase [Bacteroidetes bacterium]|nr:Gfo/Idh/MocA family oxidoreductase [Bacteroidota bacterium]